MTWSEVSRGSVGVVSLCISVQAASKGAGMVRGRTETGASRRLIWLCRIECSFVGGHGWVFLSWRCLDGGQNCAQVNLLMTVALAIGPFYIGFFGLELPSCPSFMVQIAVHPNLLFQPGVIGLEVCKCVRVRVLRSEPV